MPAYVIVEIEEVTDSTILDRYPTIAAASVLKHGGRKNQHPAITCLFLMK
jgi:hypothetical protein